MLEVALKTEELVDVVVRIRLIDLFPRLLIRPKFKKPTLSLAGRSGVFAAVRDLRDGNLNLKNPFIDDYHLFVTVFSHSRETLSSSAVNRLDVCRLSFRMIVEIFAQLTLQCNKQQHKFILTLTCYMEQYNTDKF